LTAENRLYYDGLPRLPFIAQWRVCRSPFREQPFAGDCGFRVRALTIVDRRIGGPLLPAWLDTPRPGFPLLTNSATKKLHAGKKHEVDKILGALCPAARDNNNQDRQLGKFSPGLPVN
jgi:hypothetical protein